MKNKVSLTDEERKGMDERKKQRERRLEKKKKRLGEVSRMTLL